MLGTLLTGLLCFLLFYGKIASLPLAFITMLSCLVYIRFRGHHHHSGFLTIDQIAQTSRLNHLHPGTKICFSLLCMIICIVANSVAVSLFVACSMLFLTVGLGGISLHQYLPLLGIPFLFILLGSLSVLFELSPLPLGLLDLSIGSRYLSITPDSQAKALLLLCRAVGAVSCLYLLSLSTPLHRTLDFLRKLRVPALIIELMYLIYRYLFILLETHEQMKAAATSRLGYRNRRTSLKTIFSSSLNLLFLSFRRASDCFAAMEARCYDGEIAFWENDTAIKSGEILAMALYLATLTTFWMLAERIGI